MDRGIDQGSQGRGPHTEALARPRPAAPARSAAGPIVGRGARGGAAPRAEADAPVAPAVLDAPADRPPPGLAAALLAACGAPSAVDPGTARVQDAALLRAARERGATADAAIAEARLAAASGMLGELDAARRHRRSAGALVARIPGAPALTRAEAFLWLATADWSMLGDVRSARDDLARAAVIAGAAVPPAVAVPGLSLRSQAASIGGDLAGAAEAAEAAVAAARAEGDPRLLAVALAAHAWQLGTRGETTAALAAGDELLALPDLRERDLATLAGWSAGPAILDAGDPARCAALLEPVTAPEHLAGVHPRTRSLLLELRVRCAVALDDLADARRQLAALEALPFSSTPLGGAKAGCAAALVALAGDHPLHAEARAHEAADAARRAPSRPLEIRATVLAGRAQAALEAPEVAIELFAEAERAARAAGVLPLAREAAARRVTLSEIPAELPGAAELGLTERQLEIATLVAAGHTNREVGAVLGISDHTVNAHLRAIFRRFGVKKRRALGPALEAAAAERAGDAAAPGGAAAV